VSNHNLFCTQFPETTTILNTCPPGKEGKNGRVFYMPGRNVTAQADVCSDNLMMSRA
jgi:hypothetical protein